MRFKCVFALGFAAVLIVTVTFSEPAYAKTALFKLAMGEPEFKDINGEYMNFATVGQPITVSSEIGSMKKQYHGLPFTLIVEVRDGNGITVSLILQTGELDQEGLSQTAVLWQPEEAGEYQISTFAVSNLTNPEILVLRRVAQLTIFDTCNPPSCRIVGDDDTRYREFYRSVGLAGVGLAKQQAFTGLFTYQEDDKCQSTKLVRCTPYKLDGKSVYTGSDNLDEYLGYVRIRDIAMPSFDAINLDEFLGHRVEIIGKIFRYATVTDGSFEEILPLRIKILD